MNRNRSVYFVAALLLLASLPAFAQVYGAIRGVIHDPQHRPIQGAMVMLKAKSSDWSKSITTDANGEFQINAVPLGDYSVSVASPGFDQTAQDVTVLSGSVPVVHFQLKIASAKEKVTVSDNFDVVPTDTATPTTLISRADIERTPGADRTNSLSMITDYVPGAYVTHDMLHIRGGHQTTWLLDGVPVLNTAIAQNLGAQFDPKDIDYVEVNRGSYGADIRRPHLRRLQRRPPHRLRAQQPGRTRPQCRQLLPDQRRAQLRQPHSALRLLRQHQRQSQQSRLPTAGAASRARRRQRCRGLRHISSSMWIPPTSFASSPRSAAIISRFPTTPSPTISKTPTPTAMPASGCATPSAKPTPASCSPGCTLSIRIS